MSKRTFLAALASVALLAACDKNKENEVIPVSFSSFGFYAKDNAGVLKTDYIEENFNSDVISFTLPYGTDPDALKTLVPEFTVTEGASVNVADASGAPDGKDGALCPKLDTRRQRAVAVQPQLRRLCRTSGGKVNGNKKQKSRRECGGDLGKH